MKPHRSRRLVCALAAAWILGAGSSVAGSGEPDLSPRAREAARVIDRMVDQVITAGLGIDIGLSVHLVGEGTLYEREARDPRPAASSIKTFVLLDLLMQRSRTLDTVPRGTDFLLWPGNHPAFAGFSDTDLAAARRELTSAARCRAPFRRRGGTGR